MEMSTEIVELAKALAKVQATIKPAVKDSTNPHFRSKYADLSAIWDACRDALAANGLSVVQMPTDAGAERVGLTSMLLHTSGQYIACTYSTRLQQDNAQGVGSALTYLRRYGLSALIGIVADDDDDGNAASAPRQGQPHQRASFTPPANGNSSAVPPGGGVKASEKQIKMMFAIWNKAGYTDKLSDWVKAEYNCGIDDLTIKQASDAIERLQPQENAA